MFQRFLMNRKKFPFIKNISFNNGWSMFYLVFTDSLHKAMVFSRYWKCTFFFFGFICVFAALSIFVLIVRLKRYICLMFDIFSW